MHILDRDLLAGQHRGAPPEAGRKRDIGLAYLEQRLADQIVERTVEVAAPIQKALGGRQFAAQLRHVGRANTLDQLGHFGIRRNDVGEDRDEAVAIGFQRSVLHV
ncbi:hypothetical protein D3C72_2080910 [compost metagenome]